MRNSLDPYCGVGLEAARRSGAGGSEAQWTQSAIMPVKAMAQAARTMAFFVMRRPPRNRSLDPDDSCQSVGHIDRDLELKMLLEPQKE